MAWRRDVEPCGSMWLILVVFNVTAWSHALYLAVVGGHGGGPRVLGLRRGLVADILDRVVWAAKDCQARSRIVARPVQLAACAHPCVPWSLGARAIPVYP